MTDLSVIVPVRDEAATLREFDAVLRAVLEEFPGTSEILYIENGSRDESLSVLRSLPGATVLSLAPDRGRTQNAAALRAGFDYAAGGLLATIDADLQHDPRDLLRFLERLDGFDVVVGWRQRRSGTLRERAVSTLGFILRRMLRLSAVHDAGSGLRLLRRACVADLPLYGEWHRFLPDLLAMRGWNVTECPIDHPPRPSGRSKFPWTKGPRALCDLLALAFLYRLGDRPMQAFGKLGMIFIAAGSGGFFLQQGAGIPAQGLRPFGAEWLPAVPFLKFGLLIGVECFLLGLFADAIVRALMRSQPSYRIRSLERNPEERNFPHRRAENTVHDLQVLASW